MEPVDVLIPIVVTGIVEAIKRSEAVNSRFIPLVSIVIGAIISAIYQWPVDGAISVLYGVIYGLAAVGLYEGGKQTIRAVKGE